MKSFFVKSIKWYQQKISKYTPPKCRYFPSCSEYALQAITRFGVLFGVPLSVCRILRCNRLFKGGYDPVPQTITFFGRMFPKS